MSATQRPRTYADETASGETREELRGLSRITIAARCSDLDEFEWLARLGTDFVGRGIEPKSSVVLPLMEQNPRVYEIVVSNLSQSTIAIVDISENTRELISSILALSDVKSDGINSALRFLKSGALPEEIARQVILFSRRDALSNSVVGRIESLVQMAAANCGMAKGVGTHLIDEKALAGIHEQEFMELVGRFALALGDALHPSNQAAVIIEKLQDVKYLHAGHIAVAQLEAAQGFEGVYDIGSMNAFNMLQQADDKILSIISSTSLSNATSLAPGRLSQEDSRRVLGLQAADIAAGLARRTFEQSYPGTREGASAVRKIFSRVMLNDRWI